MSAIAPPLVLTLAAAVLIWAAITDLRHYIIPNTAVLALLVLYPAYVYVAHDAAATAHLLQPFDLDALHGSGPALSARDLLSQSPAGPADSWLNNLLVASITFLCGSLLFHLHVFGGGDVKLLTALSLWAGQDHILGLVFSTAVAGGVLAVTLFCTRLVQRRRLRMAGSAPQALPAIRGTKVPYGIAIAIAGLELAAKLARPFL